ncbi:MAG: molybdenum cofactor guanylyltransferase [Armatimonadetes bacterium]|nr:molybdenum cofactor guanylyltransferase [Armatimonadota bacterium]
MTQIVRCAAILAGGKSSRMGREKALLPFGNEPLIARIAGVLAPIFPQICVVTPKTEIAEAAYLPMISDSFPNRGPLGGIHTALGHFEAPTFVLACDMPFLNADFIRFLAQNFNGSALVPQNEGGFEPLHAVYAPQNLPIFESHLRGNGKMPPLRRILEEIEAQWVSVEVARRFDPTLRCFSNWNTPQDAANLINSP